MSVASIINTGDAVHLLTDGGLFNRGVVERITNKARAFPHLNAAFAFRSSIGWWTFLIERVGYSFSSFDGVVDGIADFFQGNIRTITAGHELHGEEFWFCGWSDQRQRFEAYGISSHGLKQHVHGVASEPWALTRIDGNVIVPIDPTFYQRLATRPANTIEELGIAIAECQRQMIWENAHGDDEILVGAHVQLTTVTKDMISQKILKTWPDKGVKVSFFDTGAVSGLSADSGGGGTKGLVPAPGAGDAAAGKFLKADGTWSVPSAGGPLGQCRLSKVSSNLVLKPFNGNLLTINGTNQTIPSAGVSLAPTGLTPSTLYYIYAYMNSTTMTLEASTTGHSTSTSTGVEIKTGDATRSFVGWAYVITGPAFVDTDAQRLVVSWFNPRPISGTGRFSTFRTSTSTSYAEVNSEIRVAFISRGDSATIFGVNGGTYNSGANQTLTSIGIDGNTAQDVVAFGSGSNAQSTCISHAIVLSEGYHYATVVGRVSAGTGNWYTATDTAGDRFTLKVTTDG